jgi:hypothetical protein
MNLQTVKRAPDGLEAKVIPHFLHGRLFPFGDVKGLGERHQIRVAQLVDEPIRADVRD